jgi:hypothetical protein
MDTYRRYRRRWKDNTKMDFREVGYEVAKLNNLAPNRSLWSCLVNTVTKKIFVVGDVMPRSPNSSDVFLNNLTVFTFMSCSYHTVCISTGS